MRHHPNIPKNNFFLNNPSKSHHKATPENLPSQSKEAHECQHRKDDPQGFSDIPAPRQHRRLPNNNITSYNHTLK